MDEREGTRQQDRGEGAAGEADSARGADWANEATRAWQDVVEGAVRTASEVINEQIRMGQRTAQEINDRFYDMGGGAGQFQDAWIRPWAEMTTRWFEIMGSMAGVRPGERGGAGSAAAPANGAARPAADTVTRLVIDSRRPTTVDVDLPAGGVDLVCDPLESVDPPGEPLRVTLAAMPGGLLTLRLEVPETQPPGTYRGSVRERATSHQVGQVTVHLAADA